MKPCWAKPAIAFGGVLVGTWVGCVGVGMYLIIRQAKIDRECQLAGSMDLITIPGEWDGIEDDD
jgi:hypothetical protein